LRKICGPPYKQGGRSASYGYRGRSGLIDLPKLRLEPGARVRVLQGPLQDQIGLLATLRPHERVLVLLQLLGGQQRVELAKDAIEAIG
jgi:transcription antitermination factor NusG